MDEFSLKVWRLHPQGVTIRKADKTLGGDAHPEGVKWCGPYTNANKIGWWVFPPMDIDFVWRGGSTFEHRVVNPWEGEEVDVIRSLARSEDDQDVKEWVGAFPGRAKVDFGRVEPNICQMWTGCVFQTPPGWALMVRSPVNLGMDAPYRIQEGILETDWLTYDIWINIAVQRKDETISLRRGQWPPLAQLIPVRKESYDQTWSFTEEVIHRTTPEGDKVYAGWARYNHKKYVRMRHEKEKDSGTYFKERARQLGKRVSEPDVPAKPTPPPTRSPKATPKRLLPAQRDAK